MNLRAIFFLLAMAALFFGLATYQEWSVMKIISILILGAVFIGGAIWLYIKSDPE